MRTTYCGLVSETLMGQTVTLMGWAHRRRDHGGVIFIDLRDRDGIAQVVCDPDRAEVFALAESLRNEFCVRISGLVRRRPEGTDNANMRSGGVDICAPDTGPRRVHHTARAHTPCTAWRGRRGGVPPQPQVPPSPHT